MAWTILAQLFWLGNSFTVFSPRGRGEGGGEHDMQPVNTGWQPVITGWQPVFTGRQQ